MVGLLPGVGSSGGKPVPTVGVSRETLIKGTHNKSINKTVVWGYSIVTGMRHG